MEIWKPIVGYEGLYEVSNMGNIRSLNYNNTGQVQNLKQSETSGYLRVHLPIKGSKLKKCLLVHRLVMMAFTSNSEHKPQVNHIDGNKKNNNLNNLEWNTRSENMKHSYENKLHKKKYGKDNHLSKKVIQLSKDGEFIKEWDGLSEAAREFNVNKSTIYKACQGICKTACGYKWKYA